MIIDELKSIFSDWDGTRLSAAGVNFLESFDPPFDRNDDYRVVYEAAFEPVALNKARIEIWLTDTGHVATGIDTYERLSRRLQKKIWRSGFVAGHEPTNVTKGGLQILFDTVGAGMFRMAIGKCLGVWGSATMEMTSSDIERMARSSYFPRKIAPISNEPEPKHLSMFREVVLYEPWERH